MLDAGDGADRTSAVPARPEPAVHREMVTARAPTWERLAQEGTARAKAWVRNTPGTLEKQAARGPKRWK